MKKVTAILSWMLWIECPECKEDFDLADQDDENDIAMLIFNSKWDMLKDYEVMCPKCALEFMIEEIEYQGGSDQ